jgi:hypothetical protein
VEEVTWDDILGSIPRALESPAKTIGEFRLSPPRGPGGTVIHRFGKDNFPLGRYLNGGEVKEIWHAAEEDALESQPEIGPGSEEEESLSGSDVSSVDSLLANEIVRPFEFDVLRTDT